MLAVNPDQVPDEHLVWWLGSGHGGKFKGKFQLHLCHEQVSQCKKVTKKEITQFHTTPCGQ